MVTQWSCSPTPSLFLTPFWVLHPSLVTSPGSYLICFFSSPLLSIFYILLTCHLKSELGPSLTLLYVSLQTFSSPPQLLLFCLLVLFFAEEINLKIVILGPADTARRTLERFEICGGKQEKQKEKQKGYD